MIKQFRTTIDGCIYHCKLVDLNTQAHLFAQGQSNGAYTLIHIKMDAVSLHKYDVCGLEPLLAATMALLSCPLQLSYVVRSWSFEPYMDINGAFDVSDYTTNAIQRGQSRSNEGHVPVITASRTGAID